MLNNITIVGRLTNDPEKKDLSNGLVLVGFTLAINGKKLADGSDYIEYINCVVNEYLHNAVIQNLVKGDKIIVSGSFSNKPYQTKDGQKRKQAIIYVEEMEFVDVLKFNTPKEAEEVPAPEVKPVAKTTSRRK